MGVIGEHFLQETCLASKDAMPFDLLKKKLLSRLETMGIRVLKIYEEVILVQKHRVYLSSLFVSVFAF